MLTGMYAVRNLVLGERNDLWSVNVEQEYHEEIHTDGVEDDSGAEMASQTPEHVSRNLDVAAGGTTTGILARAFQFLSFLMRARDGAPHSDPSTIAPVCAQRARK